MGLDPVRRWLQVMHPGDHGEHTETDDREDVPHLLSLSVERVRPAEQEAGKGKQEYGGDTAHSPSVPFVEGTPVTRGSSTTASRSERATDLNCASTMW